METSLSKSKVLFVVTSLKGIGGIENYILRFISVNNKKVDITILCKSGSKGELASVFMDKGVLVLSMGLKYFSIVNSYNFVKFLRKEKFRSICDFTGDFAGPVLFLAYIARIDRRLVFYRSSRHQFEPSIIRNLYVTVSRKLTKFYSTKILSNSKSALNNFHPGWKNSKKKFLVIYNGITNVAKQSTSFTTNILSELPKNKILIGHIGNYRPVKNHKLIIDVAIEICKRHKNAFFILVGSGIEENLQDIIDDNNLRNNFIIPGYCDNIPEVLSHLDLFIFPSYNEGQPNALLEAMIHGVPIVASKIPSIEESIPESLHFCLRSVSDTNGFIELVERVINKKQLYNLTEIQDWARMRYNSESRFSEFYNEIS